MVELSVTQLRVVAGLRQLFVLRELKACGGDVLALTGANGCGKTSLLRILAGLVRPESGAVAWTKKGHPCVPRLLYLAATPALLLDQDVFANLVFMANVFGRVPTRDDVGRAVALVGLDGREKQRVRSLSTGQKRRLTFAAAELIGPEVVLADEPTNGLDKQGRELWQSLVSLWLSRQALVMVATHDALSTGASARVLDLESIAERALPGARPVVFL
jgi:ABC-type transport system involved in cytochrome c biogenesis ATPase subunit